MPQDTDGRSLAVTAAALVMCLAVAVSLLVDHDDVVTPTAGLLLAAGLVLGPLVALAGVWTGAPRWWLLLAAVLTWLSVLYTFTLGGLFLVPAAVLVSIVAALPRQDAGNHG